MDCRNTTAKEFHNFLSELVLDPPLGSNNETESNNNKKISKFSEPFTSRSRPNRKQKPKLDSYGYGLPEIIVPENTDSKNVQIMVR